MTVDQLEKWLELYKRVIGTYPAFFHLDLDYKRGDWVRAARRMEAFTHQRKIPFGIFYRGERADEVNRNWVARAAERMREYELRGRGNPDHVLFQSWHPYPTRLLPEDRDDAFTSLIPKYMKFRESFQRR
jgi:hypothetical protein